MRIEAYARAGDKPFLLRMVEDRNGFRVLEHRMSAQEFWALNEALREVEGAWRDGVETDVWLGGLDG